MTIQGQINTKEPEIAETDLAHCPSGASIASQHAPTVERVNARATYRRPENGRTLDLFGQTEPRKTAGCKRGQQKPSIR